MLDYCMFILSKEQIQQWDQFTIEQNNISSLQLMNNAANCFSTWFLEENIPVEIPVHILCGTGNNGGDGIAIAILLRNAFYDVTVHFCKIGTPSKDNLLMLESLIACSDVKVSNIEPSAAFPHFDGNEIVVDAMFGSGLNKEIIGYWADLIHYVNSKQLFVISVDMPSGLKIDSLSGGAIVKATKTVSFQSPKLSQLLIENYVSVGELVILDIGLSQSFIPRKCHQYFIEKKYIKSLILTRSKFAHKGDFGHAILIVGSHGMMGAAVLAAKACLRSGVGKLSLLVPDCGYTILQSMVPEAMVLTSGVEFISNIELNKSYSSIGIGCGLGTDPNVTQALQQFLKVNRNDKIVIDADALNIIAHENLQNNIPVNSLITPHIKEFDLLFGPSENNYERISKARTLSMKHHIYIILKGAYTCISTPEGNQYFNSTGNPGMATAGSGDVLTGVLTGLLAQGYSHEASCILGTYIHGLAGDIAKDHNSEFSLIASDIIENISSAFKNIIV